ncbi:MAG: hypothetical protein PHH85_04520 [Candidatus Methanoperedens sp.]|nr:hypothetical protein [Candidatus Methanoperedens sp.]
MKNRFPEGWDEKKVKTVLSHYEKQTEDEAVEEDELAFKNRNLTVMEIPVHLVSKVRELIVKNKSIKRNDTATRINP